MEKRFKIKPSKYLEGYFYLVGLGLVRIPSFGELLILLACLLIKPRQTNLIA